MPLDGNSWPIIPRSRNAGNRLNGIVANSANDMYAFDYSADLGGYGFDNLLLHSVRHARFLPALGASSAPEPGEGARRYIRG